MEIFEKGYKWPGKVAEHMMAGKFEVWPRSMSPDS